MSLLTDHRWKSRYDPDDGPLVSQFYERALAAAKRYDRTTGYFTARAFGLVARGVEGLVLNAGHMRMVVGCTLNPPEVEAIERGESVRGTVEARLMRQPLVPVSHDEREALELLAWMVARGILEVRLALPCDENRNLVAGMAIFHAKSGVFEDKAGDRLAFSGSVNETALGWQHNWETFHAFASWQGDAHHVDAEDESFARLWEDRAPRARVVDVPTAVRENLLRFLPEDGREPSRLERARERANQPTPTAPIDAALTATPAPAPSPSVEERRRDVWSFIWAAPSRAEGIAIAEATSAIDPWPHQLRAFRRMVDHWPPRLLIADEVGLGKTIEAGLLLRYAWLSGRAKRILVLVPKAVVQQWQIELREKFNLNWPIYDGRTLKWYPSPAMKGRDERAAGRSEWHREPFVITSSQLLRRRERQIEVLEAAEPWDLVVIDEAHHARRKSPGQPNEGPPNLLLRLAQGLSSRASGLLLLTATPMQVHPVEVWELLALLGLPPEWTRSAFLEFFRNNGDSNPSAEKFESMASLFRANERALGPVPVDSAIRRAPKQSRLKAQRIVHALRDRAETPRRQLVPEERRAALAIMRSHTPVASLVSRHTRDLLRAYHARGMLSTPIATRIVADEFLDMSDAERAVYDAVEDYIATTYNAAKPDKRTAVGFVMTTYRKRLSSSFHALRCTLDERMRLVDHPAQALDAARLDEDAEDDEDESGDEADADEVERQKREVLALEEKLDIRELLDAVRRLPADTKAQRLEGVLRELRAGAYRSDDGDPLPAYAQAIVFTQFTDTLDYLRDHLQRSGFTILCYSGRGGEQLQPDGTWRRMSREETKRRFRAKEAEILLCTDAAAEGLNFQFCGALVNFDVPWNPMRVEQRIGRIDRLGQEYARIAVVNLLYEGTVETDVYRTLRERIQLFTSVVGKLQPILSVLPTRIAEATLASPGDRDRAKANLVDSIRAGIADSASTFDIDEVIDQALDTAPLPPAPYDLADLSRLLDRRELLPVDVEAERQSAKDVFWSEPGRARISVTTDPSFFEDHPESVELWSPGSPAFPEFGKDGSDPPKARSIGELLD